MSAVTVEHLLKALREATPQVAPADPDGVLAIESALVTVADLAEKYAGNEAEVVRQTNSPEYVPVPRELLERIVRILEDGDEAPHDALVELRALLKWGRF